jgi:hypothetical protein
VKTVIAARVTLAKQIHLPGTKLECSSRPRDDEPQAKQPALFRRDHFTEERNGQVLNLKGIGAKTASEKIMNVSYRTRLAIRLLIGLLVAVATLSHLFMGRSEVLSITALREVQLSDADMLANGTRPHIVGILQPGDRAFVSACRQRSGKVDLVVSFQGHPAIVNGDPSGFELHRRRAVVREQGYPTTSCRGFFCGISQCN